MLFVQHFRKTPNRVAFCSRAMHPEAWRDRRSNLRGRLQELPAMSARHAILLPFQCFGSREGYGVDELFRVRSRGGFGHGPAGRVGTRQQVSGNVAT